MAHGKKKHCTASTIHLQCFVLQLLKRQQKALHMLIIDTDTMGAVDQKVLLRVHRPRACPRMRWLNVDLLDGNSSSVGGQQPHMGTRMMEDCFIRFVLWYAVFCWFAFQCSNPNPVASLL